MDRVAELYDHKKKFPNFLITFDFRYIIHCEFNKFIKDNLTDSTGNINKDNLNCLLNAYCKLQNFKFIDILNEQIEVSVESAVSKTMKNYLEYVVFKLNKKIDVSLEKPIRYNQSVN